MRLMSSTGLKDLAHTDVKALAVGFGDKSLKLEEIKSNLIELEDLIYSLGWDLVGSTFQKIDQIRPRTLIGSGKVEEIKAMIEETGATAVVVDHQLTGVQLRNLTKELDVIIADRNQVIIDIFAKRAQTSEGKLQVELARLMDELPRMIGGWHGSLSRLGGGIGTKGPGESALEKDRRTIRERIDSLKKKLKTVSKHREQTSKSRNQSLKVALIGYTNAGKSSVMESLTGQSIYIEDQLFATLDPLTKKAFIKDMGEVLITDTVGFINKIPTHLIDAFKSTLEESGDADILLHVIDASDSQFERKANFVEELIATFGWDKKIILNVYNKIDLLSPTEKRTFSRKPPFVLTSTFTKEGLNELKLKIKSLKPSSLVKKEIFISKADVHLEEKLKNICSVDKIEASSVGKIFYVSIQEKHLNDWKSHLQ